MNKIIKPISILILFLTLPYFNSQGAIDRGNNILQISQTTPRTGKIFLVTALAGFLQDDITGALFQISNYKAYKISHGDKVIFDFDPAFAGRVIVRGVTR